MPFLDTTLRKTGVSVVIPVLSPDTSLIEQSSCIYLYSFHLPVLLPMGMLLRLLQMNYGFYRLSRASASGLDPEGEARHHT